ncbi:MAG: hypothetical protein AAGJ18_18645, partial [Bacteroidota bacterium]
MEKGTVYIFLTSILIGYLGVSFIQHYNNKHGANQKLDYIYSESVHHFSISPLIGDVYVIQDTVNNDFTYFKMVGFEETKGL